MSSLWISTLISIILTVQVTDIMGATRSFNNQIAPQNAGFGNGQGCFSHDDILQVEEALREMQDKLKDSKNPLIQEFVHMSSQLNTGDLEKFANCLLGMPQLGQLMQILSNCGGGNRNGPGPMSLNSGNPLGSLLGAGAGAANPLSLMSSLLLQRPNSVPNQQPRPRSANLRQNLNGPPKPKPKTRPNSSTSSAARKPKRIVNNAAPAPKKKVNPNP